MNFLARVAVLLVLAGTTAAAQDQAGDFDHYVLALSWSPSWCRVEGEAQGAPQCDPGRDRGWGLHGLWPQHLRGWPAYCPTAARDPSRAETAALAGLFGSADAAWHQWKKHGRCSGLGPGAYFDLARAAYRGISRPNGLRRLGAEARLDPNEVEAAFLDANPDLEPNGIVVTCRDGLIREVRICLTRSLAPRACTPEVLDDACRADRALLPPVR